MGNGQDKTIEGGGGGIVRADKRLGGGERFPQKILKSINDETLLALFRLSARRASRHFFFFFNLTYSRWTSSLPSCLWSQRIFPSLPGSRPTIFLSRCKFSTLTTRQPMVEHLPPLSSAVFHAHARGTKFDATGGGPGWIPSVVCFVFTAAPPPPLP